MSINDYIAIFGIATFNRDFSIDYKGVYHKEGTPLNEIFNTFYNFVNYYNGEDLSNMLYSKYKLSMIDDSIKNTNEIQDYLTIDGNDYIDIMEHNRHDDICTILLPSDIPPILLIVNRFTVDDYSNSKILVMFILDQWYYCIDMLTYPQTSYIKDTTFEMEAIPNETIEIMSLPAFLTLLESLKLDVKSYYK